MPNDNPHDLTGDAINLPCEELSSTQNESSFCDIPWNGLDLAVGLVFLMWWRLLPYYEVAWLWALPQVLLLVILQLVPKLWMILYVRLLTQYRYAHHLVRRHRISRALKEVAVSIPYSLALFVFLAVASWAWKKYTGEPIGTAQDRAAGAGDLIFVSLFLSFTLTPLAEEFFFRGFAYNTFRRWWGRGVALVVQALLFAVMHPYSLIRMAVVFVIGLVLGMIYERRKTLMTSIFVHATINFVFALVVAWTVIIMAYTPFLGVRGQEHELGFEITNVTRDSPAAEAGIVSGDILSRIDEDFISDHETLLRSLKGKQIGGTARLELIRDNEAIYLSVELKERPR